MDNIVEGELTIDEKIDNMIETLTNLAVDIEDMKMIIESIDKHTAPKTKEKSILTYQCLCGVVVSKEHRSLHNKTERHKNSIKNMRVKSKKTKKL